MDETSKAGQDSEMLAIKKGVLLFQCEGKTGWIPTNAKETPAYPPMRIGAAGKTPAARVCLKRGYFY